MNKKFSEARVVINGAGSAGISICKLLLELGIGDVVMVERKGILAPGEEWMNPAQKEIAEKTNKEQIHGDLKTAMKGRDIFVGVSAPNIVTAEMVSTIADDAIVFAMANPPPEIMPDEARKGVARISPYDLVVVFQDEKRRKYKTKRNSKPWDQNVPLRCIQNKFKRSGCYGETSLAR